jgi:molybdopterin molybdotransferase
MQSLDDIAAQLQGYDPQALSVQGVHAFLRAMVQPLQTTESVPLVEALGRVLA